MASTIFDGMAEALLADHGEGTPASYTDRLGSSRSVRLILLQGWQSVDLDGVLVGERATVAMILMSDVPNPRAGDRLTVSGMGYEVASDPQPEGSFWRLPLQRR